MAADPHQRSDSSDTVSSNGSAYQLILDHVLSYPGSYEIPLRTMYTLNCAPRAQPLLNQNITPTSSAGNSPNMPQQQFKETMTLQTFEANVLAQLGQLPHQPTCLPPSFITSFVQRCFPPELILVDFPQALTGLDYLKDLETRRRREVAGAMSRLDINRQTLDTNMDNLSSQYPGIEQWIRSIEEKERKIESLYTQLFIGLRRWILINEMSLLPFNKYNCVAMLNTLYPHSVTCQPTSKLTPAILKNQRDGFFNYIRSVEKSGPRVLFTLMQQGKGATDDNGWMAVTRIVSKYLQLANSVISECSQIFDLQDVCPRPANKDHDGATKSSRSSRKADSGVSFKSFEQHRPSSTSNKSVERPSTGSSAASAGIRTAPSSPTQLFDTARPRTPAGSIRPGTALEKLARGLRTIGRSRANVTEIVTSTDDTATVVSSTATSPTSPFSSEKTTGGGSKTLRKMRSMGSIEGKQSGSHRTPVVGGRISPVAESGVSAAPQQQQQRPVYDAEQMRRQRMRWEAGIIASQKFGGGSAQMAHHRLQAQQSQESGS